MSGNKRWLLGAAAVYGLCFAANLAGAWFEYHSPTVWNLLASLIYLAFWVVFTVCARNRPGRLRTAKILAGLTLVGGVIALMARTPISWFLIIPALALTPFTAIPMYGLRMFCSWNVLYMVTGLLGGLWLIWLLRKKEGAK